MDTKLARRLGVVILAGLFLALSGQSGILTDVWAQQQPEKCKVSFSLEPNRGETQPGGSVRFEIKGTVESGNCSWVYSVKPGKEVPEAVTLSFDPEDRIIVDPNKPGISQASAQVSQHMDEARYRLPIKIVAINTDNDEQVETMIRVFRLTVQEKQQDHPDRRPIIEVSPEAIRFEDVAVNDEKRQELTIRNQGTANLRIRRITIRRAKEVPFSWDAAKEATCRPREAQNGKRPEGPLCVIKPGEEEKIIVRFAPQRQVPFETTLVIESNDPDTPEVLIALEGLTKESGRPAGEPDIDVQPLHIDFGAVGPNAESNRTVTISNKGAGILEIRPLRISKQVARSFTFCGERPAAQRLAARDSLSVELCFRPREDGPFEEELIINSNDPDEPQVRVTLRGQVRRTPAGTGEPDIEVRPTKVEFGSVNVGGRAQETIIVKNIGDAPLEVTRYEFAPPSATAFFFCGIRGPQAVTLGPGEEHELLLCFTPDTTKSYEGSLVIHSSDPDKQRFSVPLSGTGRRAEEPDAEPSDEAGRRSGASSSDRSILQVIWQDIFYPIITMVTGDDSQSPVESTLPPDVTPSVVRADGAGAVIWRGFAQEWDDTNHRLGRLTNFIDQTDCDIDLYLSANAYMVDLSPNFDADYYYCNSTLNYAASSGIGEDTADFDTYYSQIVAKDVTFYTGTETFSLTGTEGATLDRERTVEIPFEAISADVGDRGVAIINGFDINNLTTSPDKLEALQIRIRDVSLNEANRTAEFDIEVKLKADCKSAECGDESSQWPPDILPEWLAEWLELAEAVPGPYDCNYVLGQCNRTDYELSVTYLLIVGGRDAFDFKAMESDPIEYEWKGTSNDSKALNPQDHWIQTTILGEPGYDEAIPAFKGINLYLNQSDGDGGHWMKRWESIVIPRSYDSVSGSADVELRLVFQAWDPDVTFWRTSEKDLSVRKGGSAAAYASLALLQFKTAALNHTSIKDLSYGPVNAASGPTIEEENFGTCELVPCVDLGVYAYPENVRNAEDTFEMTYRVIVDNFGNDPTSDNVKVRLTLEGAGGAAAVQEPLSGSLAPGQSSEIVSFTFDVPKVTRDLLGDVPEGTTTACFSVEDLGNPIWAGSFSGPRSPVEWDFSDNEMCLDINAAYWKPDYTFAYGSPKLQQLENGAFQYQYAIQNVGPVSGPFLAEAETASYLDAGIIKGPEAIPALSVGEKTGLYYSGEVSCRGVARVLSIGIDIDNAIVEGSETNNVGGTGLCEFEFIPELERDLRSIWLRTGTNPYELIPSDVLADLHESPADVNARLDEMFDNMFDNMKTGPILPGPVFNAVIFNSQGDVVRTVTVPSLNVLRAMVNPTEKAIYAQGDSKPSSAERTGGIGTVPTLIAAGALLAITISVLASF